jgi:GMP synthase-like glutamine amidotransferase
MQCLVSGRYLESDHGENHVALSLNALAYAKVLGFRPTPIWAQTNLDPSEIDLGGIHLLLLTGGESIGENQLRDSFEHALLKAAVASQTPVLGICRGLQVMMSFYGFSPVRLEGHAGTRHSLEGEISGIVNSYHNFGFSSVPEGFRVTSYAHDGSVESAYHRENNWLGVMWHPERETIHDRDQANQILGFLGLK